MSFAADAVMDVIAPSQARPNARAPDDDAGPSFEEHLAAATPAPEPATKPAQTKRGGPERAGDAESKDNAPAKSAEAPEILATALAAPPPAQTMSVAPTLLEAALITSQQADTSANAPATAPQQITAPTTPVLAAAPLAPQPTPAQSTTAAASSAAANALTPAPAAASPAPQAAPTHAKADAQTLRTQETNTPAQAPPTQHANTQQQIAPQTAAQHAPQTPPVMPAPAPSAAAQPQTANAKAAPEPVKGAPIASAAKAATALPKGPQAALAGAAKTDLSAFALNAQSADAEVQGAASAAATFQGAAHAHQTGATEHAAARAAPMAAAQVSREIIRRFDGGNTRFEMRLDPPELGRIEVRLEVTRDHRVSAVIAADNPAALADLSRHARELEQSLQAAGLELSEQGLSFDLRQGDEDADQADANGANAKNGGADTAENDGAANTPPQTARLERWRGARIDVMA